MSDTSGMDKHSLQRRQHRKLKPFKPAMEARGVPYSTGRAAHFRGELPVTKIGATERHRAWYVTDEDVDAWLERNTERHTTEERSST
jgi:hypothetical protein